MISEQKVQISVKQFSMLAITFVIATADIFLPSFVAQEAKADAWISVIIGTISSLIIVNIFITLSLKFPDKTVAEFACDIFGKPLGKIIGFSYAYFFIFIAWAVARELEEIFIISFNPYAPHLLYEIIVIIVAMYALTLGIEVIARLNELLLPIGGVVLFSIALINIQETQLSYFLPILYDGITPSLRGSLLIQTWLIQTVILLQLMPVIREKEKIRKYLNVSIIVLFIGLIAGVMTIAVFGPALTSKLLMPALEYVILANLGRYIQSLDIMIMVVWVGGIFIKIAISFYVGTLALSQVFGIKSYKSLIIPVGILIIVFASVSSKMISDILYFLKYNYPFYILVMAFVIPLLMLVVVKIKEKRGTRMRSL